MAERLISVPAARAYIEATVGDQLLKGCMNNVLDAVPAVDAVPVVHGRWIETLVPDGYVQKASRLRKQCSVCGWTNACRYNYCPHCGARMDLEV